MRKLIPHCSSLFLVSLPTFAQKTEVFGGYVPFLGVTADFSAYYNSGTHFYTYTFGPRYPPAAPGRETLRARIVRQHFLWRRRQLHGLHYVPRRWLRCRNPSVRLRTVGASGGLDGAKKAAKFSKRAKVPKRAAKGRSRSGDDDTRRNSCAKCATRSTIGPDGLSPGRRQAL